MTSRDPLFQTTFSRRGLFQVAGAAALSVPTSLVAREQESRTKDEPFRYCFNTSTIRGQKLDIVRQVEITAQAGYHGIEPWIRDLEDYVKSGGSLKDLKKRIEDAGLIVESAIAFAPWIVDDDAQRAAGLEQARREMGMLREIGGTRIAAPPAGATKQRLTDLAVVAQRYRALLNVGVVAGVTPQLELWGFSQTLSRLGELAYVATESDHPAACVLPDVYHIYKGGSGFAGLELLSGRAMHCFHINDYPADPPRETINDADRVYPGDGVAPLREILRTIHGNGFRGALSLELFNPRYWELDALEVATVGLQKTRDAVADAMMPPSA